ASCRCPIIRKQRPKIRLSYRSIRRHAACGSPDRSAPTNAWSSIGKTPSPDVRATVGGSDTGDTPRWGAPFQVFAAALILLWDSAAAIGTGWRAGSLSNDRWPMTDDRAEMTEGR